MRSSSCIRSAGWEKRLSCRQPTALPKARYAAAYVDLWPTDGEASFVTATARAITESMSGTAGQLGSSKHLIQKMFLDRSRPLYRAAGHYPLSPIETKHWIPLICGKFRDEDKLSRA